MQCPGRGALEVAVGEEQEDEAEEEDEDDEEEDVDVDEASERVTAAKGSIMGGWTF